MPRINVTQAAEMAGVSRAAMRRAIASGRVHRAADGLVDTKDLARAGYTLQPDATAQEITAAGTQQMALLSEEHDLIPPQRVEGRVVPGQARIGTQVAREQEGLQASATVHLELAGHQVDLTLRDADEGRLLTRLEAVLERLPHAAMPAGDTPPQEKRQKPIRYRIFDLLRAHPSGLTRRDIEKALGTTTSLSDTLVGMVRHGHLIRVAKGTYALPPD